MTNQLAETARPFLDYLDSWYGNLPEASLAEIVGDAPEQVALFSIDMINGFCREGPLSSPRVGELAGPVAEVFRRAHDLGVRAFVLAQDAHPPDAVEFEAYPPHGIAGTPESQTITELQSLPFADTMTIIPKNSINAFMGTTLEGWMQEHRQVNTFVIVGDCSDLCVYSAVMYLRTHANAHGLKRRIIVPAHAVNTYDIPVEAAREAGIFAHDGDLHHVMFLHHMALNGVEVVARV